MGIIYYTAVSNKGEPYSEVYEATITLRTKSDEGKPKRENHRMILCMNSRDFLNPCKILKFIQPLFKIIIQHDQIRFVLGLEAWINIRKSTCTLLQKVKGEKGHYFIR